ncbi:tetratricopeptide repeat protein [Phanerochaete sordida]|uniref:Tetratricopeptide repeat protein n=1 Tax=Phanerochaete sordida TaxID=48140 RepID=A0A9P3L871_9APHY|nr:tetratricopeptide repeat protein [Phanerochaete sordida]
MLEWKDAFNQGIACFRAQKYEEALGLLTQTIELHASDSTVFDSRAAVYERLGRTKEALLDSKQVIKLSPEKWQGYARSARLFTTIKKYESALTMLDLALERVKPEDNKRRTELTTLRSDVEIAQAAHAKLQRQRASKTFYHFGRLPVEIAHTIFSIVVEEDHSQVVILGQVCQDWRRVVVNTPNLWTFLTLSAVNPTVKAALWKTRSKGKLKALCIRSGDAKTVWALHMLESVPLDLIRTLSLNEMDFAVFRRQLPLLSLEVVSKLEKLELHHCPSTMDVDWLHDPPILQLRTLSVKGLTLRWGELAARCTQLTTLHYQGCYHGVYLHDLATFLERNSNLETIEFFASDIPLRPEHSATSMVHKTSSAEICLHALAKLTLSGPFMNSLLYKLVCPSLQSLRISRLVGAVDAALDRVLQISPPAALEELIIDRISLLDPATLVRFLRSATSLRVLHLLGMANVDVILEALAGSRGDGILCPRLVDLNVSHCPDVRDGPLIRLVKARLPRESSPSTPEAAQAEGQPRPAAQPAQLTSLVLDGCLQVTGDILPWLRQNVAHVSCQFATKKQASWKR